MKKTTLLILIAVLVIIGLGIGGWLIFRQSEPPPPVQEAVADTDFTFPESVDEINWEDREIFKTGLNQAAQSFLDDLLDASTYYISLEIPDDLVSGIQGHQVVRYFNTEEEPLDKLYFRLYPNYQGGTLQVQNLTLDNEPGQTALESENTSLRVDLDQPLQPGESVVIELDFSLEVPTEMGGNYGLLGYFEDVLVLDTFYPMIPAYDEDGWYSTPPQDNGDLTYQDASFYVIQVQAPDDLVLASSGMMVDRQAEAGRQRAVFAAGPARDFYLAGSREYVVLEETEGDLTVRVLTRPEFGEYQKYALDFAIHAIEIFSERVGDYPYTEFEVVSSPMRALGIEYPGITSIVVDEFVADTELYGLSSLSMLESTLAHEVGHMWFYNTVGNDQGNQPWMDEALVQYLTYIYYLDYYGNGDGYIDSWYYRWGSVEYADIPIGMPAGDYHGAEYSGIVYGRGPMFYLELEKEYGIETVMEAIQDYYNTFLWDNGDTEDIRAALEKACECDLSSMFEEWIYENQ
jgi:hypothetical protein